MVVLNGILLNCKGGGKLETVSRFGFRKIKQY